MDVIVRAALRVIYLKTLKWFGKRMSKKGRKYPLDLEDKKDDKRSD
jgi:hypothetical protein